MDINLSTPQTWKQLAPQQLLYVSRLMLRPGISPLELHTLAFARFAGIKILRRHGDYFLCLSPDGNYFTLQPLQASSFARQMQFLTSGVDEITPLSRIARRTHVSPRLYGAPLVQYIACENYYQAYIHTRQQRYLHSLAACFYTSGRPFDDSRTARRARHFITQPPHILYTVFLWYTGLKTVLSKHFPNYFQKIESDPDLEPQAPDMQAQIRSIIRALTGGDVTRNAQIYQVDTWEALAELDAKAREARELEARIKKIKP
jgi:hypothetical protein